jgi:hypothetical protein
MAEFMSTMGAPLTEAETKRILDTWDALWRHTLMFQGRPQPDPVEMLNYIADMIGLCYEVRRAIDNAWYHANKRAFPDEPKQQAAKRRPGATLANALAMLTEDEIAKVMAKITGDKP